jgi:hypothetical protein
MALPIFTGLKTSDEQKVVDFTIIIIYDFL